MSYKSLNLDRNKIIKKVKEFCSLHYRNFDVSNITDINDSLKRLFIEINDENFYIDFHYNSDGTTTINITSGTFNDKKELIAKSLKKECIISRKKNRQLTVNINEDLLKSLIKFIESIDGTQLLKKSKNGNNSILYKFKGKHKDKITINFYCEGNKILIQGKPLKLFHEIVVFINNNSDISESELLNDYYDVKISQGDIDNAVKDLLKNSYKHIPTKIKRSLSQAIYNTKLAMEMPDYTFLVFPAYRV